MEGRWVAEDMGKLRGTFQHTHLEDAGDGLWHSELIWDHERVKGDLTKVRITGPEQRGLDHVWVLHMRWRDQDHIVTLVDKPGYRSAERIVKN